jgi:hypothetical protein
MISILDFIRQKKILLTCLAASLLLHLSFLIYFYYHPILIHSSWRSLFGLSGATPEILDYEEENVETTQKTNMIEEAFQQVLLFSSHFQQPHDLAKLPKGIALSPHTETPHFDPIELPSQMQWESTLSDEMFTTEKKLTLHEDSLIRSLLTPEENPLNFVSQIQIDLALTQSDFPALALSDPLLEGEKAIERDFTAVTSLPIEASEESQLAKVNILDSFKTIEGKSNLKVDSTSALGGVRDLPLPVDATTSTSSYFLAAAAPEVEKIDLPPPSSSILPELEEYQLPTMAMATSWNDDFNVDFKFLPQEEGKGYLFSVALTPSGDLTPYSLKQTLYFIIDRSNSVQKHRFSVFKRAVMKALACMQNGDAFNIYIIDKKVTKLTQIPLTIGPKALRAAEEFLEKQEAGGMFAGSDIYGSLEKILPEIKGDNLHTAILLTDGQTLHNTPKQQKILSKWLENNSGKLSLYTAAVGQKNNLLMLDFLSSISGGKLLYSDTHASFPRKLAKLILDLKNPVVHDLIIAAAPQDGSAQIEFSPATFHLPALYANQPYTIYGSIDNPCNFELIVQGRHGNEWIAIKKSISFNEGEKGTRKLEKQWKAQQAQLCYAQFLKEGKPSHLKDAKEILKANRAEIAFE